MATEDFDRIDEGILVRLQGDARNVTTAAIGDQLEIAGSTVATRISRMENAGVISEYNPTVAYEAFGYDHHIQLTGTVPPEDEDEVIDEITTLDGIVRLTEMVTDDPNVVVEVVARTQSEVESKADELTSLGMEIKQTNVVQRCVLQPCSAFETTDAEDDA